MPKFKKIENKNLEEDKLQRWMMFLRNDISQEELEVLINMDKDIKKVINIYNDLLLMGEEPIKLIVMIANQFRLILQVKLMVKNGYKERDMASEIGEHPYRVKLASNARFTVKELITYIKKLQKLDYYIKSGNIDKNFGLEFFLLNI